MCLTKILVRSFLASGGALCSGQPALQEACDGGLKWLVLHWQAPWVWPELPHMVQSALNTHARQQQGEVEVLMEIARLHAASRSNPDWKAIKEAALLQNPPCAPYLDHLISYVKKQAPELMTELNLFAKAFARKGMRGCGSEFFQKLNGLSWGKGVCFPYILHAALCGNLSAPPRKLQTAFAAS